MDQQRFDTWTRGLRSRRAALGGLLGGLTAFCGLSAEHAADAKRKRKRAKTRYSVVTRTFTNPATINIRIDGPASPYPSALRVSGFRQGRIKDVTVILHGFEHTFPDDVDILLVGPRGQTAFLVSDVGTNADLVAVGGVSLVHDDEAPGFLPDFGQILSGRFRPTNGGPDFPSDQSGDTFPAPAPQPGGSRLAVFDGTNPNGLWRLFVVDDRSGDAGFLKGGWSLQITARIKRPARR